MQAALKLTARVLPGKRVEFTAPELTEGEDVELIVLQADNKPQPEARQTETRQAEEKQGVWDYIQSLPPSTLTMEDWERIEREFQEERNSWGD